MQTGSRQECFFFSFLDLGTKDYKECWDYQEELLASLVNEKRTTGEPSGKNYFLLVEHPHVYTLGKSGDENNMLIRDDFLRKIDASFYRINRGGDITYHGLGQLVGYPILDLDFYHLGIRQYIAMMEDAVIRTLSSYGLAGGRKEGATGVWLDAEHPVHARKICAIGVRVSRSVTMHGFALNVNTNLRYFSYINPCGFVNYGVTSIRNETNSEINMSEVKELVKRNFNLVFNNQ